MRPVLLLSDCLDLCILLIQLERHIRLLILNEEEREKPYALENMRERKLNIDWRRKLLIGWEKLIHYGIENEAISQSGLRYTSIYQSYFSIMDCYVWQGKFFIFPIYVFLCYIIFHLYCYFINGLSRAYSW